MTAASTGRVVLYWDYDTQWGADRSRAGAGPRHYGMEEFTWTERLLRVLEDHAMPSCFAVVGAAALPGTRPYHDPGQVREIHAAGHEVGSHAMHHEWLPALSPGALDDTLRRSKAVLEECIGHRVTAFVPPFNQPFDYAGRLSISLSERRQAGAERVDVPRLCGALAAAGYATVRLSHRSLARRALERMAGRRLDRPTHPEHLRGVLTLRLNTPGGFGEWALAMVRRVARQGGTAVVYGHPHSLGNPDGQGMPALCHFLEEVASLRREGRIAVACPRELVAGVGAP